MCACDRDRLYVGMAAFVWLCVFICVPVDEINRCHLCLRLAQHHCHARSAAAHPGGDEQKPA